jgi:hypothetical protein
MQAPELLARFVRPLNAAGITYMVTGGVAAIVYGEPRLTNDIDLVMTLSRDDAVELVAAFPSPAFYAPPVEVVQEEAARPVGGHFNLLHLDSALRADIYLAGEDALAKWALSRRRTIELGPESVPMAPLEYVILKKLTWIQEGGGDRHRTDIAAMLRLSGHLVDQGELEVWVERLGVAGEWKSLRP